MREQQRRLGRDLLAARRALLVALLVLVQQPAREHHLGRPLRDRAEGLSRERDLGRDLVVEYLARLGLDDEEVRLALRLRLRLVLILAHPLQLLRRAQLGRGVARRAAAALAALAALASLAVLGEQVRDVRPLRLARRLRGRMTAHECTLHAPARELGRAVARRLEARVKVEAALHVHVRPAVRVREDGQHRDGGEGRVRRVADTLLRQRLRVVEGALDRLDDLPQRAAPLVGVAAHGERPRLAPRALGHLALDLLPRVLAVPDRLVEVVAHQRSLSQPRHLLPNRLDALRGRRAAARAGGGEERCVVRVEGGAGPRLVEARVDQVDGDAEVRLRSEHVWVRRHDGRLVPEAHQRLLVARVVQQLRVDGQRRQRVGEPVGREELRLDGQPLLRAVCRGRDAFESLSTRLGLQLPPLPVSRLLLLALAPLLLSRLVCALLLLWRETRLGCRCGGGALHLRWRSAICSRLRGEERRNRRGGGG
mmetsp:Transcript_38651/g.127947  ORF Transcript_38651/g.127947 Transcript_38651/m.127947 type:complete len:481 (-) Transcript_38651:190-1632(-)